MQIQGDTTIFVTRSGFVDGAITAQAQPGMESKVMLMLGGGLTVSLPLEYAQSLARDIGDVLVKIKKAEARRKRFHPSIIGG